MDGVENLGVCIHTVSYGQNYKRLPNESKHFNAHLFQIFIKVYQTLGTSRVNSRQLCVVDTNLLQPNKSAENIIRPNKIFFKEVEEFPVVM